MKIACLAWGSLIWKTESLPAIQPWLSDGPRLPVEFSRIGDGGELATAICLNAPPVPVYWALLNTANLDQACRALRLREQIPDQRVDGVGCLTVAGSAEGVLSDWAKAREIDAVIWTMLPPRIDHNEGRVPTLSEALTYLDGLNGEKRQHAQDYIEQVPAQIDTPYRRAIRQHLGWG